MTSFAQRCGIHDMPRELACEQVAQRITDERIERVRIAWCDLHGVWRGKTLMPHAAVTALRDGVGLVSTVMLKDTSDRNVYKVFEPGLSEQLPGFGQANNLLLLPDPASFRMLPWADGTGWLQAQPWFDDATPVALDTRHLLQSALTELAREGYGLRCGLEVEFHIYRIDDERLDPQRAAWPGEPPAVSMIHPGYNLLAESWADQADPALAIVQRTAQGLGLPLRSLEIEYGPSQFELTFGPTAGVLPADTMVLLRSAIKQICQRAGLHATFMCRPKIPNVMSSGWHLHQSLRRKSDGVNAFMPQAEGQTLSEIGMHYLGGLKAHACGAAALASPTINGYRRYRPFSLAPDRAIWARDNRGAMLRVLGGVGQNASRIENRVGEPTANPYLYLASQLFSGLDGIHHKTDPGPSADAPYETPAEQLPRSLGEALACLRRDEMLNAQMGKTFVDYLCHIKEAEIARFNLEVSEWEHREYFDMF